MTKDFEEVAPEVERNTISFTEIISTLKERYQLIRNTVLANFGFYQLKQGQDESFDTFINQLKMEANRYSFQCNQLYAINDAMNTDQIILGATNNNIKKNGLNNQWGLEVLIKNRRKLEAATTGAKKLNIGGTIRRAKDC